MLESLPWLEKITRAEAKDERRNHNVNGTVYLKTRTWNLESRFTEAEKDCDRALTLDAGFVKAYHRRGVARTGLGRSDAARQDFRK